MATSNSERPSILFGDFELDLQQGVLRKNGVRIRCQEQPLQVLATLVERPGELITRDELRRRVWSHDTYVDFDHALNTAVKKIRATLNDDADAPRYIETVPRRGYRFVASLEQKGPPPPPAVAPSPPPKANRSWLWVLGTLALAQVVALAWMVTGWRHSEASSSPEFQRLTFDETEWGHARFTPDGNSVVYTLGGQAHPPNIYVQNLNGTNAQLSGIEDATLLSVSHQGELAVLGKNSASALHHMERGMLARVSLGSNAPRELLPDVEDAEWSPDGRLAVVRRAGQRYRLEFPIGKVLFESTGWIESPRFSPLGDAIAFLDHPVRPDDRGSVTIVDLKGAKLTLSRMWESARGLAWSPRGNEVWFAAARSGVSRRLYAVGTNGRERQVLSVAGGLSLRDISSDGRVLLTRDNERMGILFMGPGQKEPRELSWKDWSIAMDISPDGKRILFGEEGENSGFSYQVGVRPTDGSPPVILGPGIAQSLSPDGNWALSILPPPDDQILLLPTGAGISRPLARGSVERYEFFGARWTPDSRQIVFVGYETGHTARCYAQSIDGGAPRPFTPDGMMYCTVSPSGAVLAIGEDHHALLYGSVSSDQPEKQFSLEPDEMPSGWSADGKYLYISDFQQKPVVIERLELATGRRQPWKQISLAQTSAAAGQKSDGILVAADGQSYVYNYSYHASDLYLVQGLR